MKTIKKYKATAVFFIVFFIIGIFGVPYIYKNKLDIIQSPVVTQLIPLYRSLRKMPDLLFIPRYVFYNTKLDTYEIYIKPENINILNSFLPNKPFGTSLSSLKNENKTWVSADFIYGQYKEKVKIRYRGNQANHWNSFKKSMLIKFPKDHLFNGMRELTLVIPSDRRYFAMSLNHFRARKMDMIVPDESFVRVKLNGADHGVYIAFEHWSPEWVEKQPISSESLLLGTFDLPNVKDDSLVPSIYTSKGLMYWRNWNMETLSLEPVSTLVNIVENAPDDIFEKIIPHIIDLKQYYARDIINILSGSYHNVGDIPGANNLVLYFDVADGKFRPIPYNTVLFTREDEFPGEPTTLQKRIWNVPKFKKERDSAFHSYVEKNKNDDIKFMENWFSKMNNEFYSDNAKADNNLVYFKKMRLFSDTIKDYFDDPFNKLDDLYEVRTSNNTFVFKGTYTNFMDVIQSPIEFTRKHPQFIYENGKLTLYPGTYFFGDDVIIPFGFKLVISQGVTIFMGEKASIISYSPVIAKGALNSPIKIYPSNFKRPWGVFGVINTGDKKSIFENVILKGGSEDRINGVYYSGMLAMHNSDGMITNSLFDSTFGDDGVNIKKSNVEVKGNTFLNNPSDGIDIDFPKSGTIIISNKFLNNSGDAIDLSWSNVTVVDNIIIGCGDKGVSVGEKSYPKIINNVISKCDIGIAVKDLSKAQIDKNTIISNRIGISAYQKKPVFGGGLVNANNNIFWNNGKNTRADSLSKIILSGVKKQKPLLLDLPQSIKNLAL
jgi:parallel beta-helix repeat protein